MVPCRSGSSGVNIHFRFDNRCIRGSGSCNTLARVQAHPQQALNSAATRTNRCRMSPARVASGLRAPAPPLSKEKADRSPRCEGERIRRNGNRRRARSALCSSTGHSPRVAAVLRAAPAGSGKGGNSAGQVQRRSRRSSELGASAGGGRAARSALGGRRGLPVGQRGLRQHAARTRCVLRVLSYSRAVVLWVLTSVGHSEYSPEGTLTSTHPDGGTPRTHPEEATPGTHRAVSPTGLRRRHANALADSHYPSSTPRARLEHLLSTLRTPWVPYVPLENLTYPLSTLRTP